MKPNIVGVIVCALALAGCDAPAGKLDDFLDAADGVQTIRLSVRESLIVVDVPASPELAGVAGQAAALLGSRCVIYRHETWRQVQMHCAPILPPQGT